jgi:putative tricarboxylic transport membrane protein
MAEGELLRSYQISGGRLSYLLGRPITMIFVTLLLISLFSGPLMKALKRRHKSS